MSEAPTSPPTSPPASRLARPGWLDTRLVLGVLLVLVSVVVGARVLAAADRTQLVWAAARTLPPGTVLAEGDLRATRVRLFDVGDRYLAGSDDGYLGYVVGREVAEGELLPLRALEAPGAGRQVRLVSVPVLPGRYPERLARGELVDVWATPEPAAAGSADPPPSSRLVLEAVPVDLVPDRGSALSAGTPERAVVLAVDPSDVEALVAAMAAGRIDLVRVHAAPGAAGPR